jgi:hypothetical protein
MAFTVSDDHKQQEKVWKTLPDYVRQEPVEICDALTEKHIAADGKLAQFVGVKAYEKAGGAVLRDLLTTRMRVGSRYPPYRRRRSPCLPLCTPRCLRPPPQAPQRYHRPGVERADGVPLFVEELTKAVVEAGADRGYASNAEDLKELGISSHPA